MNLCPRPAVAFVQYIGAAVPACPMKFTLALLLALVAVACSSKAAAPAAAGQSPIVGEWSEDGDAGGASTSVFYNANGSCGILLSAAGVSLCSTCRYTFEGGTLVVTTGDDAGESSQSTSTPSFIGETMIVGGVTYTRENANASNGCP